MITSPYSLHLRPLLLTSLFLGSISFSTLSAAQPQTDPFEQTQVKLQSKAVNAVKAEMQYPVIDLSLNSVVLFSLNKNPDIRIFLERYAQAVNAGKEAEAGLYPEIDITTTVGQQFNAPLAGGSSGVNAYATASLTFEQILFDGFETQHRIKSQDNLSQAAYWNTQERIESILTDATRQYMEILRYQEEVKLNEELLADIENTVAYIRDQFQAGAADKVIMDYANSRLAFTATQLNRAKASLNDAVSNLEFLTGKLPPKFRTYYPEMLNPNKLDLQYYMNLSEKNNSRVKSKSHELESSEHRLAAQKARDYPSVNFGMNLEQKHNSGGDDTGRTRKLTAGVRFDYTLFDGQKRKHAKSRIKSEINEIAIQREQILNELRREVKLAYNQIQSNLDALDNTEIEITSSTTLKKLNEENFKLGNINVIELIESAERLTAAQIKKVDITNNLYLGSYRLLITSSMIKHDFFCASCDPA